MNETIAREYSESLGQIFDGGYRQAAWADKQKIPQALGLTMREWVYQYLGGYVRMTVEQRKEAVLELAAEGTSQTGIARALGIAKETVSAVIKDEPTTRQRGSWTPVATRPDDEIETVATRPDDGVVDLAAMQKGASEAARNDPLAALYGATAALSNLKDKWQINATDELDPEERRRLDNDIEAYVLLLRKIQTSLMEAVR